jgi:type II secretory pathway pseudopilin PulG
MEKRTHNRSGQSLVEYFIVLALISIITASLLTGLRQRSQANLHAAADGFEESQVAASTSGGGKAKPHSVHE